MTPKIPRPRNYDPEQPGLFSPEMLGEAPLHNAPAPQDAPQDAVEDISDDIVADINMAQIEEPIFFMSFGSGSSGNCSYIGDKRSGFLIDAGIDGLKVTNALAAHGISMEKVRGIILTHDHGDHVRYLWSLLKNNRHMLVYCTPKTLNAILRRHSISRRVRDYHRAIYKEFDFKIGNFTITPFEVLHDGADNAGFFISHGGIRMAVATDLGCISPRVDNYMRQAQFIVLESNYDLKMLIDGHYPDYLKARIRADHGHLDNTDAAQFLARIYSPALRYVFLCHLSKDNNTPQLALDTHRATLAEHHPTLRIGNGSEEFTTDLQLVALPRFDATPLYALRPQGI
ncbi:MAG: MBL fold metallo-hydrolase [Muribaculaceae bacterium]|nr:MBL fold metallo-hydrolase [Muribaculaceae bacterium]